MPAPATPSPPTCRYCKKLLEEHVGADHAFRVYTAKKRSASNSFLKAEAAAVQELFRCAVLGQPVSKYLIKSKGFIGAMHKITKMVNAIELAEKLDKIGEEQYEQKTVA